MSDLAWNPVGGAGDEIDWFAVFDAVPSPNLLLSPNLTIVGANAAYLRATMTTRERILGRHIFEVFPDNPDDPQATGVTNLAASLSRALKFKRADAMAIQRYDIRRPDELGGGFDVRYWSPVNTPVLGPDGAVRWVVHRVEDVTEVVGLRQHGEKQQRRADQLEARNVEVEAELVRRARELQAANEQLLQSRERLAAVLNQAAVGIAQVDLDGRLMLANAGFCEIVGRSPVELQGRVKADELLLRQEDRAWLAARFRRLVEGGESLTFEAPCARPDGSVAWTAVGASLARRAQGQPDCVILVARDITPRKRAEASRNELAKELINAQESEREQLARELHDQIGQYVTALILELRSIRDSADLPPPARDRLERLQHLAERTGRQVHRIGVELRPTALDDLGLRAVLAGYIDEWSLHTAVAADFHWHAPERQRLSPIVETAAYRIVQQALANVSKHAAATRASLVVDVHGGQLTIIIEDNGRGFDPDAVLAGPVRQRRLGLLGMQDLARMLEGTLTIESAPANGTTLYVRLPLESQEVPYA